MAVPLKKWYRLGKKTFWLFLLRSGKYFILFLAFSVFLTYKIAWGSFHNWFYNFLNVTHANWYFSPQLFFEALWLLIAGSMLIVFLRAWVLYRQYKFMLDEHAFHVRRGIFLVKEIVIPYHHIQNVEIKQPYFYRFIGLAELDITTLGNNASIESDLKKHKEKSNLLPIIDHRIAKALAHELVHRGSSKEEPFVVEKDEDEVEILEDEE